MRKQARRQRTDGEERALLKNLKQQVIVQDTVAENTEMTKVANETLLMIGEQIGLGDPAIKHAKYLGSAAVHIYQTENLGVHFFVSQVDGTIGKTPEAVASAAFSKLQNEMMIHYGRAERRGL